MKTNRAFIFDIFGTIFNIYRLPTREYRPYRRDVLGNRWDSLQVPDNWVLMRPYTGAIEALQRINEKYKVALCVDAPSDFAEKLLRKNGVVADVVITPDKAQACKPNRSVFCAASEALGIPNERCFYVADANSEKDLQVARELGMTPLKVRTKPYLPNVQALASIFC